jgi:aldehyde:ferredoxin oxidoreductase
MELVEKGKLDAPLRFGDTTGILDLIDDIAYKRGLGAELSEGSKRSATRHGAPELAMQVKGLELPAYDPRGAQGHALGYATSNRGGCHLRSYLIGPEVLGSPVLVDRDRADGKADLVMLYQDLSAAMDCMVVCRFTNFAWTVDDYAEIISAGTGIELSGLFNLREGFTSKDDTLPPRFFKPLPEGGSRNRIVHLEEMLTEYYRLRGWDSEGRPTQDTLKKLDLPVS